MKIISVRQPWAWAIFDEGKDIENRTWRTAVRGRVLVHASKATSLDEWDACMDHLDDFDPKSLKDVIGRRARALNAPMARRGGIVGSVEIVDCVTEHTSPWFFGPFGFVLCNPLPLPFIPLRGRLGFFDAPPEVLEQIRGAL